MTRFLTVLAIAAVALLGAVPLHVDAGQTAWSSFAPPRPVTLSRLGSPVALAASVPHDISLRPLGAVSGNRTLTISIGLKLQNQTQLAATLHDLYTPGSPQYRHWLTPQQFQARFAPSSIDQKRVLGWLRSRGFQAAQNCDSLLLTAVASVDTAEATFGTPIQWFKLGSRTVFANTAAIHVPRGLASVIGSVSGLNDIAVQTPQDAPLRPSGDFANGFMPSELADLYGFTQLYNAGDTGKGIAIGLPEFTVVNPGDISAFDKEFGLGAPNMQLIPLTINGTQGGMSTDTQTLQETELDIEVAHGMAPDASLLVYQGPDSSSLDNVFCQMIQDNKADIIASSFGADEKSLSAGGDTSEFTTDDGLFQQAATQGQTVLAASGDQGAFDVPNYDPQKSPLLVDFPSSDPWVTGVGGTSLTQNADGTTNEVTWGSPNEQAGGGGGLSIYFKRPSWQTGPGVQNSYSNGYRQVPDISALAGDPGYQIYTEDDNGTPDWQTSGGTSAASPLWAAFLAITDEALHGRVGFINPTLYRLGASANPPFNDITQGDNLYYPATPGWDFATGWGSLKAPQLLAALGNQPPPTATPTATPTSTPTATPVPKKKLTKCKKGYKLVKGKCKKVKKKTA